MDRAVRRIGVTMRLDRPAEYDEPRDGLARDWGDFFRFALPGVRWIPIPSLGAEAVDYATDLEIDGLVLTGGGDPGSDRLRDETEERLLSWAEEQRIAVLGVCRGMQMMLRFHGATALHRLEGHIGTRHFVAVEEPGTTGFRLEVNSYHRYGLHRDEVPSSLRVWAVDGDGNAEAISDGEGRRIGVLWHPEREKPLRTYDRMLVRSVFLGSE